MTLALSYDMRQSYIMISKRCDFVSPGMGDLDGDGLLNTTVANQRCGGIYEETLLVPASHINKQFGR